MNRDGKTAFATANESQENNDGCDEKRWFQAWFCGDGSGQAARDCKQGRKGQPRRWSPAEFKPLKFESAREGKQGFFA